MEDNNNQEYTEIQQLEKLLSEVQNKLSRLKNASEKWLVVDHLPTTMFLVPDPVRGVWTDGTISVANDEVFDSYIACRNHANGKLESEKISLDVEIAAIFNAGDQKQDDLAAEIVALKKRIEELGALSESVRFEAFNKVKDLKARKEGLEKVYAKIRMQGFRLLGAPPAKQSFSPIVDIGGLFPAPLFDEIGGQAVQRAESTQEVAPEDTQQVTPEVEDENGDSQED